MLRIQKRIRFKDPVGREYTTDGQVLSLEDGTGIHTVGGSSRYLYVHLSGQWQPTENQVRAMTGSFSGKLAQSNILWPELECYDPDSDMLCGFLTPRIDLPGDLKPVRKLITGESPDPETALGNLQVGLNLAKCIRAFHQIPHRVVLGAPHPGEFYVDARGRVFSLDAYRHILDTYVPGDGRYLAPEYITAQNGFTPASDAFSFALILFELLTGVFPFGAHDPDTEFSEAQIIDMILNGESIYFYANSEVCIGLDRELSGLSPELPELFRLALDYCGRSRYEDLRPKISDWIEVLERVSEDLSRTGDCNSPDFGV